MPLPESFLYFGRYKIIIKSILAKGNIQDIPLKKFTHVNADVTACKDYKSKVKTHIHN